MTSIKTLSELDGSPHANVFPDEEPKTVRLTLDAGESVPPHSHPGREIVFYVVAGELELELGGQRYELATGDVARFDGDQDVSPETVEETTALIVLAERTTA